MYTFSTFLRRPTRIVDVNKQFDMCNMDASYAVRLAKNLVTLIYLSRARARARVCMQCRCSVPIQCIVTNRTRRKAPLPFLFPTTIGGQKDDIPLTSNVLPLKHQLFNQVTGPSTFNGIYELSLTSSSYFRHHMAL